MNIPRLVLARLPLSQAAETLRAANAHLIDAQPRIGGAAATDEAMLTHALHLREQEMSLRDIAAHLVISQGEKKGRHPSGATVMRMLREHDERAAAAEPGSL